MPLEKANRGVRCASTVHASCDILYEKYLAYQ